MSTDDPEQEKEPHDPAEFYAGDIRLHAGGRITIPSRHREHNDIGHRDVLDVLVYTEDTAFQATDLPVDTSGRIRIPGYKRRLYGIEDGDRVDIEVATTGLTMPDGEEDGADED